MNRFVWIVMEGAPFEGDVILGVHSSRKKAEEERDAQPPAASDFKRWVERRHISYPKKTKQRR